MTDHGDKASTPRILSRLLKALLINPIEGGLKVYELRRYWETEGVRRRSLAVAFRQPSLRPNFTPKMTFGNWMWPSRPRQLLSAASASLKIMASAVLFERHPLERTVPWGLLQTNFRSTLFGVRQQPMEKPRRAARRTIPIVFVHAPDPVNLGFVVSLAHPGGNITGFTGFEPSMAGKWLEILKEMAAGVALEGAFYTPARTHRQMFSRLSFIIVLMSFIPFFRPNEGCIWRHC